MPVERVNRRKSNLVRPGGELSGSLGLAASLNCSAIKAMAQVVHGAAPSLVGHNRANPAAPEITRTPHPANLPAGFHPIGRHDSVLWRLSETDASDGLHLETAGQGLTR